MSFYGIRILVPVALLSSFGVFAAAKTPAVPSSHICYLSMNNGKEFPELEKFLSRLNKVSPDLKITLTEYQAAGENPEESFRKMIRDLKAQGRHCDGLVLSGHHTGSFSGARANGTLGVEFLESLSCEPANREFFSKIQSVWLQGCRTMGVCKVAFGTEAERRQFAEQVQTQALGATASQAPAQQSADFHTERVGAVLEEDHLTQSYAQLNTEFSATLDQDNPLSTRYLRIFPRAALFGWTATAPGPIAKSEYSLPYHIAHTTKHMDDRKDVFQNPQAVLRETCARAYGSTLKGMLHRDHAELSKGCTGDACQKGWMDQASSPTMGYGTNEANALPPLATNSHPALIRAKALECDLKNPSSPEAYDKALREILENSTQIAYNFNSLWELLQRAEDEGDEEKLAMLRAQFAKSVPLANFINHKFQDPTLGTLRKIDYYAFYRDMMGKKNDVIEGRILEAAKTVLTKETKSTDQRDYQQTMIQSLAKNKLLNDGFVNDLLTNPAMHPDKKLELMIFVPPEQFTPTSARVRSFVADPRTTPETIKNVLRMVAFTYPEIKGQKELIDQVIADKRTTGNNLGYITSVLKNSKDPIPNHEGILKQLIDDPRANGNTLYNVAESLQASPEVFPNKSAMLRQILDNKKFGASALDNVADAVGDSKHTIPEAEEFLERVISHPKVGYSETYSVVDAIGESTRPLKGADKLLTKAIDHKEAAWQTLEKAANAISDYAHPMPQAGSLLKKISQDKRFGETPLTSVAVAIGRSKQPIPESRQLLESILVDKRSGEESLTAIVDAVASTSHPLANPDELLNRVMQHKKSSSSTIAAVAKAVGKTKLRLENPKEFLSQVINDKRSDSTALSEVVGALTETAQPIAGADEMLKKVMADKRADSVTRAKYVHALASGRFPSINTEKEVTRMMTSPKAGSLELVVLAESVAGGNLKVSESAKIMEKLALHPSHDYEALAEIKRALAESRIPLAERDRLIQVLEATPVYRAGPPQRVHD